MSFYIINGIRVKNLRGWKYLIWYDPTGQPIDPHIVWHKDGSYTVPKSRANYDDVVRYLKKVHELGCDDPPSSEDRYNGVDDD